MVTGILIEQEATSDFIRNSRGIREIERRIYGKKFTTELATAEEAGNKLIASSHRFLNIIS